MIDDGLRVLFHSHLTQAHWQAVETGGTGRGIPDSNYCFPGGVEGWVEFKATSGWTVSIRPEQVAWVERRIRMGGRVHVAVRRRCQEGPRRPRADELWLLRGEAIRPLRHGPMRDVPPSMLLYRGPGGPSAWDWAMVLGLLAS